DSLQAAQAVPANQWQTRRPSSALRCLLYGNPATIDMRSTSEQPGHERAAATGVKPGRAHFRFRKGPFRIRNAARKFRNFASASGRKTYNASREGEALSRWKGFASRSCFCPLDPFPQFTPRGAGAKGVLNSGDRAVPVGRDPELRSDPG